MHSAAIALTWIAGIAGLATLLYGLAGLRQRQDGERPRWALTRVWLGLFVVVETFPRVAGWPAWLVLTTSLLAFVPLVLAAMATRHGQAADR